MTAKRLTLLSAALALGLTPIGFLGCSTSTPMNVGGTEPDWWTLSDEAFGRQYASMAFGDDLTDQSKVAWMLFSRVNIPTTSGGKNVLTWELWPNNGDTFAAGEVKFAPGERKREAPDLSVPGKGKLIGGFGVHPASDGEERARNMLSYDYIRGQDLYTMAGVYGKLKAGYEVDFPIGSVELKAYWTKIKTPGAYTFHASDGSYYLLGLHIMAKMAKTPADPFTSADPSWFWTTFEFSGNAGLANAQSLITYKDALPLSDAKMLLAQAGLPSEFDSYLANGTQIRFADSTNSRIVLGNTKMEDFAGHPKPNDPAGWTSWDASCHSCHATAAFSVEKNAFFKFGSVTQPADGPVGELPAGSMDGYSSVDFVWSIPFNAK